MLHAALHNVIGEHATQAGSLNEEEFLRFDFTHFEAVSNEELRHIEQEVNEQIWNALTITTTETDVETAKEMGAMALLVRNMVKWFVWFKLVIILLNFVVELT